MPEALALELELELELELVLELVLSLGLSLGLSSVLSSGLTLRSGVGGMLKQPRIAQTLPVTITFVSEAPLETETPAPGPIDRLISDTG